MYIPSYRVHIICFATRKNSIFVFFCTLNFGISGTILENIYTNKRNGRKNIAIDMVFKWYSRARFSVNTLLKLFRFFCEFFIFTEQTANWTLDTHFKILQRQPSTVNTTRLFIALFFPRKRKTMNFARITTITPQRTANINLYTEAIEADSKKWRYVACISSLLCSKLLQKYEWQRLKSAHNVHIYAENYSKDGRCMKYKKNK